MPQEKTDLIVNLMINKKLNNYTKQMDIIITANSLQKMTRDELRKMLRNELHIALNKILKPEVLNTLLDL